jgi:hypothetical protein
MDFSFIGNTDDYQKDLKKVGNWQYDRRNELAGANSSGWDAKGMSDAFDAGMGKAMGQTQAGIDEGNAFSKSAYDAMGTEADVNKYLNPKMDAMLEKAANMVRGGAGGMLQSSATNNAVVDRVAGMAGEMWDKAQGVSMDKGQQGIGLGQGMGQAALSQGQQTADIYNQQWQNRNTSLNQQTQLQQDAIAAKAGADNEAARQRAEGTISFL